MCCGRELEVSLMYFGRKLEGKLMCSVSEV